MKTFLFGETDFAAKTQDKQLRVSTKPGQLSQGLNTPFVVTKPYQTFNNSRTTYRGIEAPRSPPKLGPRLGRFKNLDRFKRAVDLAL
jgi:hypothetical protein